MLCGLEIHQRLVGSKLFCSCPSPAPDEPLEEGSYSFFRALRPVFGESGEVDIAAEFEAARMRSIEYVAPPSYSCLVEADEEPPHPLNIEHLKSALAFALFAGSSVVDEIHVMRKVVVDGSNTSGFQRTALIAHGGFISCSFGKIPIETICLEEESAGILPALGQTARYRIDRLGIPLIEIATAPVFTTPAQAQEGAKAIGLALRMLPASMRGLGTIRQDVNISIPQGARVEIKGLQDISLLPSVIENEVKRQQGLVEIIGQMKSRGISGLSASFADVSFVFSSTSCSIISKALSLGGVVLAAKLPKMAGLLGYTFYQGRRFGSEISDYAKIAGGVLGIIHSDEDLAKYGISQQEISKLCSALSIGKDDAFIIIADKRQKAEAAIHAAISRSMLLHVPSETRKADEKGGSSFMRPMAGAHRMYPETDIPPIRITKEILDMALEIKIESVQDRLLRLNSMLGPSLAQAMLRSHNYGLFEKLVSNGISPKLAAITLEQTLVSLKREGVAVDKISPEALESLLKMAEDKLITKAAIPHVLKEMALHPNLSVQKIIESNNLHRLEGSEIEKAWESCGRNMRLFLEKYRLVVDGEDIMQLAKKHGNSK